MFRKGMLGIILALTVAILGLTACTKDQEALKPAVLEGQSEHWKISLDYKLNGNKLDETVIVKTTITQEDMDEAKITIEHKKQQPAVHDVIAPLLFKTGQPYTFPEKAQVTSWRDTEQVTMEWKIGGMWYKEYITPENKAAAAKQ